MRFSGHYTAMESNGCGLVAKGTPEAIGLMLARLRELGAETAAVMTDAGIFWCATGADWTLTEVERG